MTNDNDRHQQFMRQFLDCERSLIRYVMYFVPNANDARDIVQNTAVALWKKFDAYDTDEPFVAWATRFARLEARQFLHKEKRWHRFLDDEVIELLAARTMELEANLDERRLHLRMCLRKLPEDHRSLIEAYYFKDQTVDEIAASFKRNRDAVYKMLQRIRAALMECVSRQMGATSP